MDAAAAQGVRCVYVCMCVGVCVSFSFIFLTEVAFNQAVKHDVKIPETNKAASGVQISCGLCQRKDKLRIE